MDTQRVPFEIMHKVNVKAQFKYLQSHKQQTQI